MRRALPWLCVWLALGCSVKRTDTLAVRGLHIDPNAFSAAPEGSLTVADNVVIQRLGRLEPRNGFQKLASPVSDEAVLPVRLFPWALPGVGSGNVVRMNEDETVSWLAAPSAPILNEQGDSVAFYDPLWARTAEARKNLYFNASDGIRKLEAANSLDGKQAGITVLPVIIEIEYAAGAMLADTHYAAYRVILVRTDANGTKVRSASSGQVWTHNETGGAYDTIVHIGFSSTETYEGDVLELYRTRTSEVEPDEEQYLTSVYTLTSSDISAGLVSLQDSTQNADLGAALYINESREGVEGSNFAPPIAGTMALFNGSLFVGGITPPKRISLRYQYLGDLTGITDGIGYRTVSGIRTNGSADIPLGLPEFYDQVRVGMIFSSTSMEDWDGAADEPVIITAITGTTSITLSQEWTGATDGGPVAFTVYDTVHFGDDPTTGYWPIGSAPMFMQSLLVGRATLKVPANTDWYAYSPGVYWEDNDGGALDATIGSEVVLVIEERRRGDDTERYVQATGGEFYQYNTTQGHGVLPDDFSAQSVLIPSDPKAHTYQWSKTEEPEHFPLTNYAAAGVETQAILALAPTRDALWIFKQDGLWRLSGVSAASGWRCDPFDPTLRLLTPDSWVVLDDVVYAWTNRGPMMITDSGAVPMSSSPGLPCPIQSVLDERQQLLADMSAWDNATWMAADPQADNVFLGVELLHEDATQRTEWVYVFNVGTREWTRWQPVAGGLLHMAHDGAGAKMLAANGVTGDVQQERTVADNEPEVLHADYQHTIAITDVTDGVVTITAGDWEPGIGDVVKQSGAYYTVVTTPTLETFTVDADGLVVGAGTAYESYDARVEWNAKGTPTAARRFSEVLLGFSAVERLDEVTISCRTSSEYEEQVKAVSTGDSPTVRGLVPRECARATVLWPGFSITDANASWSLNSVAITSEDLGTRVAR